MYIQLYIYIWFCTNMLPNNLSSKTQAGFICLNQIITPFISKRHFVHFKINLSNSETLDVLGVDVQNHFEVLRQQNNDQRSWAPHYKLVLLAQNIEKWPLQFQSACLVHFKTNLNNFCGFGCTKCRSTK